MRYNWGLYSVTVDRNDRRCRAPASTTGWPPQISKQTHPHCRISIKFSPHGTGCRRRSGCGDVAGGERARPLHHHVQQRRPLQRRAHQRSCWALHHLRCRSLLGRGLDVFLGLFLGGGIGRRWYLDGLRGRGSVTAQQWDNECSLLGCHRVDDTPSPIVLVAGIEVLLAFRSQPNYTVCLCRKLYAYFPSIHTNTK